MKLDLQQNTEQWLEFRKGKFTASNTADLFNVGFNDRLKLAHIKYGDYTPFCNEAMKLGTQREAEILKQAEIITGEIFFNAVFQSDEDERFIASLDGINETGDTICECKCSQNEFLQVKENKEPSEKYYLQIQHQLYCSGAEKCYFIVENSKELNNYEFCLIYKDFKTIEKIKNAWIEFEKEYKDKELPPLANELIGDEIFQAVDELRALLNIKKDIEKKEKELKEFLINKANGLKSQAYGASIYSINRQTKDYAGFLKQNNLTIPPEFIKNQTSWAVKI